MGGGDKLDFVKIGFRSVAGMCVLLVGGGAVVVAQAKTEEPIKTTLCELVRTPDLFNGKVVEVRAIMRLSFEKVLIVDEACSARIWLDFRPLLGKYSFERIVDSDAIFTGRFDHISWWARLFGDHGFGHLGGWDSQLVPQAISNVVKAPLDRPANEKRK